MSFYKLSRNIYPLSLLYSFASEPNNKIMYYKNSFHSEFKQLDKNQLSDKLKHIIYCILDQVEELNTKICLEIILNKKITTLWISNVDFKFDIYNILKNINLKNPKLDKDTYESLNTYLADFKEFNEFTADIEEINKNLSENKNKFYVHLEFIYNIIDSNYILINAPEYISFIGYILYDLDNLNFYNKRWILSIFETSLLNANVLNIKLTNQKGTQIDNIGRFAETASITQNSFISAKSVEEKIKKLSKKFDIQI